MKAPITSAQAMSHPAVVETINALVEIADELRADRDSLKLDALRYRWLVQQHFPKDLPIAQVVWKRNNNPHGEWVNLVDGSELNNQIDAAMKEGAK